MRHGLGGIAGALALSGRLQHAQMQDWAREAYCSALLHHEQALQSLRRVLRAAHDQQVSLCVLKGPALGLDAYGDPGLRPYSDLDIAVADEQAAQRLAGALDCPTAAQHPLSARVASPGKLALEVENYEVELCFPTPLSCDPMLDLLALRGHEQLRVPRDDTDLIMPEPGFHMVLLLLHMSVNHTFSRLIWFVDLAQLWRAKGKQIGNGDMAEALRQLGMRNAAAVASCFCRRYLLPAFPVLQPASACWRFRLLDLLTGVQAVVQQAAPAAIVTTDRAAFQRRSCWHRAGLWALWSGALIYATDPESGCCGRLRRPAVRGINRLLNAAGWRTLSRGRALTRAILLALYPLYHYPVVGAIRVATPFILGRRAWR